MAIKKPPGLQWSKLGGIWILPVDLKLLGD
jgi:hypothetical protein